MIASGVLIELVMSFGSCEDCPADIDDDGFVGVLDLIAFITNFGPCPGTVRLGCQR